MATNGNKVKNITIHLTAGNGAYATFNEPSNKSGTYTESGKKKTIKWIDDGIECYEVHFRQKKVQQNADGTFGTFWTTAEVDTSLKPTSAGNQKRTREFTYDSDALAIRFGVRPNRTAKGKKAFNSVDWVTKEYEIQQARISTPSAPTVESLVNYSVTLSTSTTPAAGSITPTSAVFHIIKVDSDGASEVGTITAKFTAIGSTLRAQATYSDLSSGDYYATVHYEATGDGIYNYSLPSAEAHITSGGGTIDFPPPAVTNVRASRVSSGTVLVTWDAVPGFDSSSWHYVVAYANNESDIKSGNYLTRTSTDTQVTLTGLEDGYNYWIKVSANNGKEGAWSNPPVRLVVASKPNMPTIWTLDTGYKVGDTLTFYWTHNSTDSSKPTASEIYYSTSRGYSNTIHIDHNLGPDDYDYTFSKSLVLSDAHFGDGDTITWKVRTKGISNEWSDWSGEKSVNLYTPPSLGLRINDGSTTTITEYPFDIYATASPSSQNVLSRTIKIIAQESYETVDLFGRRKVVNVGDEVYSKIEIVDISNPITITPHECILENNILYKIEGLVNMSSGLSASNDITFSMDLDDSEMEINFDYEIDAERLTMKLSPRCVIDTGEEDEEGLEIYELYPDATLTVVRINYDGSITILGENLINNVMVYDPHMPLYGYRYRITAVDEITGNMVFTDVTADEDSKPLSTGIVIQWDDASALDTTDDTELYNALLFLPYNAKITNASNPDVELVEYIGRADPVSYYGTQKGQTYNITCEFDKEDVQTIEKLNHLQVYSGDVYIRDQRGAGYWANINVSFNTDYDLLVVPVSINVTKVHSNRP